MECLNCAFCGKATAEGVILTKDPPFPMGKFVNGKVVLLGKGDVVCFDCRKGKVT